MQTFEMIVELSGGESVENVISLSLWCFLEDLEVLEDLLIYFEAFEEADAVFAQEIEYDGIRRLKSDVLVLSESSSRPCQLPHRLSRFPALRANRSMRYMAVAFCPVGHESGLQILFIVLCEFARCAFSALVLFQTFCNHSDL